MAGKKKHNSRLTKPEKNTQEWTKITFIRVLNVNFETNFYPTKIPLLSDHDHASYLLYTLIMVGTIVCIWFAFQWFIWHSVHG